ncbi:MAG: hypothetical protein Q8K58_04530 [Acidimicrobiales bacterium]|nr:hypothetical protein [Acidimicrobiales bacterium]
MSDHPALVEAVGGAGAGRPGGAAVLPDERLWGRLRRLRRAFLVGCLRALDDAIGVDRSGRFAAGVPSAHRGPRRGA